MATHLVATQSRPDLRPQIGSYFDSNHVSLRLCLSEDLPMEKSNQLIEGPHPCTELPCCLVTILLPSYLQYSVASRFESNCFDHCTQWLVHYNFYASFKV